MQLCELIVGILTHLRLGKKTAGRKPQQFWDTSLNSVCRGVRNEIVVVQKWTQVLEVCSN